MSREYHKQKRSFRTYFGTCGTVARQQRYMIIFSRFIFFCIFISLCNKIAEADPVNCSWCKYKVDQSSIISIYFNAVPGAEMGSDISISF